MSECAECGKKVPGNTWEPGQVCIMNAIFCCSVSCGEAWARKHISAPWELVEDVDGSYEIREKS